ncbi:MAG: hypothetical protein J0J10_00820 [Bosea sp.]|uniref:hypothetical protein n=1 Tax=Bosea sp. (in: a-proteobacteria) TaxID=1871050 RepID=UPI001AC933C1|nr:hypothetical protein [Bosea sp. (in: a-proteobacteria)]MBN9467291.1 hypothetical protein [Bosea sp. (in: a-proteobacteria)]
MMYTVTLHLARTPAYPDGNPGCGYEVRAPLDSGLHLDPKAWQRYRGRCRVRRFWTGDPDRYGWLVHRAGGSGGATWCIDYDDAASITEEPGYRLDGHRFAAGDYISIRNAEDGVLLPFRVAALKPIPARSRTRQRVHRLASISHQHGQA